MEDWLWEICNRMWKGEGWVENWREGVVMPVVEKVVGKRVEDYADADGVQAEAERGIGGKTVVATESSWLQERDGMY